MVILVVTPPRSKINIFLCTPYPICVLCFLATENNLIQITDLSNL